MLRLERWPDLLQADIDSWLDFTAKSRKPNPLRVGKIHMNTVYLHLSEKLARFVRQGGTVSTGKVTTSAA